MSMETKQRWQRRLMLWMRELLPACREVSHLQSRALDEPLPARVRLGVRCHLLYCVWCRRYGRQLRLLHEALQRDGERLAGEGARPIPAEARERMKQVLKAARNTGS